MDTRSSALPEIPVLVRSLSCCAAAVALLLTPAAAAAVPPGADGHYATYDVTGGAGAWQARVAVAAAGFPAADVTSGSSGLSAPGGTSAFLGPDTPFGGRFGTSRGLPYLSADTAPGRTPSTTTIAFDTPTPDSGWGFALGDVDADTVRIAATDAAGRALTGPDLAAALGWRSAFNYCAVVPKPATCSGPGPFTDTPTWDAGTATLVGSGTNTLGAAGWFEPTVALRSLTLVFTLQTGTPNYQFWLAALSVPVSGTVEGVTAATPDVTVDLLDGAGRPVREPDGTPVSVDVAPSGEFTISAVTNGDYELRVEPGTGGAVTGPRVALLRVDVDSGPVTLPAGTFRVRSTTSRPTSPPAPPPTPAPRPTTPTPMSSPAPAARSIAATGSAIGVMLLAGLLLVAGGAGLVWAGRRATGTHR